MYTHPPASDQLICRGRGCCKTPWGVVAKPWSSPPSRRWGTRNPAPGRKWRMGWLMLLKKVVLWCNCRVCTHVTSYNYKKTECYVSCNGVTGWWMVLALKLGCKQTLGILLVILDSISLSYKNHNLHVTEMNKLLSRAQDSYLPSFSIFCTIYLNLLVFFFGWFVVSLNYVSWSFPGRLGLLPSWDPQLDASCQLQPRPWHLSRKPFRLCLMRNKQQGFETGTERPAGFGWTCVGSCTTWLKKQHILTASGHTWKVEDPRLWCFQTRRS